MKRSWRPAMLRRLPTPRFTPPVGDYILDPSLKGTYPALAEDLLVLERVLVPSFNEANVDALRGQNRFRFLQLCLIAGSAAATLVGAVHTAIGNGAWVVGALETLLAGVLGIGAIASAVRRAQLGYLGSRLVAERLRGEYFVYLARAAEYEEAASPSRLLAERVADITAGGRRA